GGRQRRHDRRGRAHRGAGDRRAGDVHAPAAGRAPRSGAGRDRRDHRRTARSPRRLILRLASSNANKARELERAVPAWKIELLEADDYPPEDGETYYDNALIKARFGHGLAPESIVLGEDSGIEVVALGGNPGVHSARWAEDGV